MRLPQEDFCQAPGVSPALKYESHGGPGIADAMNLLLGSRLATQDRELFLNHRFCSGCWLQLMVTGRISACLSSLKHRSG